MEETDGHVRKPIVFIVEHQSFDYSHAETYGTFQVLKAEKLAPNAPDDERNISLTDSLRRQMSAYIPGYDYVIPTGAPSRIMLIGLLMAEKSRPPPTNGHFVTHNVLGWDGKTQRYLHYKLIL